jgi:hypothetical protein
MSAGSGGGKALMLASDWVTDNPIWEKHPGSQAADLS